MHFKESVDFSINFKNLKLITHKESDIQKISLYKHKILGKILVINNEVQHVELWAPLYHEMVVHLPSAFIPKLENVLILGGGSLFASSEVLKYDSIKCVTLVDHDKNVIDIINKNYRHAKKVLKDKRFQLIIKDVFQFLKTDENKYDLIVNDSIDLLKLYRPKQNNIINVLCDKLNYNGICSDVVYRSIFEKKSTLKTIKILKTYFSSSFSLICIPEYPGIFHVLCLWSKTNNNLKRSQIVNNNQKKWIITKNENKRIMYFYNPKFLNFYQYLPNYLKLVLKSTNI